MEHHPCIRLAAACPVYQPNQTSSQLFIYGYVYSHRGNWTIANSIWKQQAFDGVNLTMQCAKKCSEDANDCRGFAYNTASRTCSVYHVELDTTNAPARTYANPMTRNFQESSDSYAYIRCKPGICYKSLVMQCFI